MWQSWASPEFRIEKWTFSKNYSAETFENFLKFSKMFQEKNFKKFNKFTNYL